MTQDQLQQLRADAAAQDAKTATLTEMVFAQSKELGELRMENKRLKDEAAAAHIALALYKVRRPWWVKLWHWLKRARRE